MPNVVHVIETLGSGGAERLLYTNLRHLQVQSTVVTVHDDGAHWKGPIEELGVRVVSLGCRGKLDLVPAVRRLRHLLDEAHADLVHTHLWKANVVGRLAGRLAGVPVISSIHNPDYEPEVWRDGHQGNPAKRHFFREIDRGTARIGCRRMIAVSEYVRQSAHRHLGFPIERIDLVYNPIAVEEFIAAPARSRNEFLAECGLPKQATILLHVGRVSPQKGLHLAIRSLPRILAERPDTHLLSAGATDDANWLRKLQDESEALGISRNVHFLGARRDVASLLHACDVFVFPSIFEGMGMALAEAMASGCACVASTAGAIPELIHHGVDGWLVPTGDVEALASMVLAVLADPALRVTAGRAAAASATGRFDPSDAARRLERVYEQVLH
jgi:glycosyltransferase involved in cell wall biosynthesis